MKKKSFILYSDQQNTINKLTDEQAGKLIKAIYAYVNGEKIELDNLLDLVITPFITALDKDAKKYEETCEKRAKAGAVGGKQRVANANRDKQNQANQANACNCKQKQANQADTDNENDTDIDNVSSSAEEDNKQPLPSWISCYKKNIGLVDGIIVEQIERYELPDEVVEEAIKEAVKNDVRRLSYILAILQNYKKHNITTKTDVEARRVEFEKQKRKLHNKDKPTNAYVDTNSEEYKDLEGYYIT